MKFEIAQIHFWVTFPNWESGNEGRTGIFPPHHSPLAHCARSHHPPLAPLARPQPPAFEIRASRSALGEPVEKTSCRFFDSYRKIYRSDFNPANKQTALWHFTYPYQLLVNDGSNQSDIYPSTSLICHNLPIARSCLSRLIEFKVIFGQITRRLLKFFRPFRGKRLWSNWRFKGKWQHTILFWFHFN